MAISPKFKYNSVPSTPERVAREKREDALVQISQRYQTVRNNLQNEEDFNLDFHRNKTKAAETLRHNAMLLNMAADDLQKLAREETAVRRTNANNKKR